MLAPARPLQKLLVVLSDADLRDALAHALRGEGFEVVGASTTDQALAYLRRGRVPSAVLYDLVVEVEDGKRLQLALASAPKWSGIPQLAFAPEAHSAPRSAHVEVPISLPSILHQLRRITGTLH